MLSFGLVHNGLIWVLESLFSVHRSPKIRFFWSHVVEGAEVIKAKGFGGTVDILTEVEGLTDTDDNQDEEECSIDGDIDWRGVTVI